MNELDIFDESTDTLRCMLGELQTLIAREAAEQKEEAAGA